MSDKFSILRRPSQKVRPQDFDATDDLASVKKTPHTEVDSSGKKRVVISDDSEVIDRKISRQSDNGASRFGYAEWGLKEKKVGYVCAGLPLLDLLRLQSS